MTSVGRGRMLRVALVAMPWAERERPSCALGALSAYIKRERPEYRVKQHFANVEVAALLGPNIYARMAGNAHVGAALLYAPLLHAEQTSAARTRFSTVAMRLFQGLQPSDLTAEPRNGAGGGTATWETTFDDMVQLVDDHLSYAVDAISAVSDVIGLTTSFEQLVPNLAFAKRARERGHNVRVVFGGSTVQGLVGRTLVDEYDFIDAVVQGEGELPLVRLLDRIASERPFTDLLDVVSRTSDKVESLGATQSSPPLADLPVPDYDDYAELAQRHSIPWRLHYEASRGCWWDRTRRTGDPMDTCYFCNLNTQGKYREKAPAKVARELHFLCTTYQRLSVTFVDNVLRHELVLELADELEGTHLELDFFYEMRVNIKPYEFLRMREAGLNAVLFGIEGLSSSYLKRIGKGTTTIQNLQAMRLCEELDVVHAANLISGFPGATRAEILETCDVIRSCALSFTPLDVTGFGLFLGSTVELRPQTFGISNIRNPELYKAIFPRDVWARLRLYDLEFDLDAPEEDWEPVWAACDYWRSMYQSNGRRSLLYRDGRTFLSIEDRRFGDLRFATFTGLQRDIYLYCLEIHSMRQILQRFSDDGATEAIVEEIVRAFVEDSLVYRESNRVLSLAVAHDCATGARRIREAWRAEQLREQDRRQATRLPVLAAESIGVGAEAHSVASGSSC